MSNVPGQSPNPSHNLSIRSNKFQRVDNNPNVRNAQYVTPYVSAPKNPVFNKSPLTSVQLNRKRRIMPEEIQKPPASIGLPPSSAPTTSNFCQNNNLKKILFWILLALALLALLTGLFFLIRYLINNSKKENIEPEKIPYYIPGPKYTGINPIYVPPIPLSSLDTPVINGLTYATNTPSSSAITQAVKSNPSLTSEPVTSPVQNQASVDPTTAPTVNWIPDASNNYVNPINVYPQNHI